MNLTKYISNINILQFKFNKKLLFYSQITEYIILDGKILIVANLAYNLIKIMDYNEQIKQMISNNLDDIYVIEKYFVFLQEVYQQGLYIRVDLKQSFSLIKLMFIQCKLFRHNIKVATQSIRKYLNNIDVLISYKYYQHLFSYKNIDQNLYILVEDVE
ncbi:hypothetical protein pb186bvf_018772 [Paramecium bursaria]